MIKRLKLFYKIRTYNSTPPSHLPLTFSFLETTTFNSLNGFFWNFTPSLNNMSILIFPGVSG